MGDRIRVAVIFGGKSTEHAISCISAGSVIRALDPEKYEVIPIGITPDGQWFLKDVETQQWQVVDGLFPQVRAEGNTIALVEVPGQGHTLVDLATSDVVGHVDVVFPVLHGPDGEDGTIQGLLECAGMPYVGAGVFASAVAMDKAHLKMLMQAHGIPVGPFQVITDAQWRHNRDDALSRIAKLGLPLFVKPCRAGSSVGISKVKTYADLVEAIEVARQHDPKVIVEASVENAREVECGVLGSADGTRASVCAEIIVREGHEFYDFDAKYVDDSVQLVVPADLSHELAERVQQLAIQAFDAIDGEGLSRVDVFIAGDEILINEINTMPGFTSISLFPRMWGHSGVDYPALVDVLVQDALRRGTGLR